MRYIPVLVGALLFANPVLAETPCDFKGVSVGNKMSPAQIMSALGVTSRSFRQKSAARSGTQRCFKLVFVPLHPVVQLFTTLRELGDHHRIDGLVVDLRAE